MIVTVQIFGLNAMGGGPRILRSLLAHPPVPVLSICTQPDPPPPTRSIEEIHLPIRPYIGRLESTRLGPYLTYLNRWTFPTFRRKLERICRERGATAIHAIPQGADFVAAFEVARTLDIPFYLTVHDDLTYNQRKRPDLFLNMAFLKKVWLEADGRMVISETMGREYNRLFGERPFAVVTDGLTRIARRMPRLDHRLVVYFMGSVHLSYQQNFERLLQALEHLQHIHPDREIILRIRGGQPFKEKKRAIRIEQLPWGSQADVEQDMQQADLLYFPLPFEPAYSRFTRFSLSTKLITYLGSGLPILYHGPPNSAAAEILHPADAAEMSFTRIPEIIASSIMHALHRRNELVAHARSLAEARFMLEDQRRTFWEMVAPSSIYVHPLAV